jgi:hypothetical protein
MANLVAIVLRFLLFREWVFRRHRAVAAQLPGRQGEQAAGRGH